MALRALYWWIDRWRKSTAYTDLTLEEQGAYRNLLDEATLRGGPIPDDDRILAKACGDAFAWERIKPRVLARFERHDDGWRNATLDSVIQSSTARAARQQRWRETHNAGHNAGRLLPHNKSRNEGH